MKKWMRVFLKSLLCGIFPFSLLLSGFSASAYTGSSSQALTSGADIRVMSYNVLVDNDESLGGWSWGKPLADRGDKASAAIAYYQPDVIGFQECNYKWHVSLRENLPDYDFVNADVPEQQKLENSASLGKKDWMCTTMMYNTKTLELVENELVGYSVNYWGCIQRMRYVSMALFKVKKTGEMFVFTSTHFDAERNATGKTMRCTQARELANRILHYMDTYGCPVISTGDYNSGFNDEPITIIRESTGMTSHSKNRGGIDYILYSQGVSCNYFTVVTDSDLDGASDHQPVFGDFALQDGFSFPTTAATTAKPTTTTTTTTTTTRPTAFRPTGITHNRPVEGTTTTTEMRDPVVVDPSVTDAPATTTTQESTAPSVEASASVTQSTPESTATASQPQDQEVEARPVKKGNDKLVYIGIAAAVAVIAGGIVFVLLRKKK